MMRHALHIVGRGDTCSGRLDMSGKETMTDVAYNWMTKRKKEVEFLKLWQTVSEEMDIPADKQKRKKSQFYSELMLDNRFASLGGNKWDLRNRRTFDEVHVDTADIELEDDDEMDASEEEMVGLDLSDQDNENNKY